MLMPQLLTVAIYLNLFMVCSICLNAKKWEKEQPFAYNLKGNVSEVKEEVWLAPKDNKFSFNDSIITVNNQFLLDKSTVQRYDSSNKIASYIQSYIINRKNNKTLDSAYRYYYQQEKLTSQSLYIQSDRVDSVYNKYKKRTGILEASFSYNKQDNLATKILYTYKGGQLLTKRTLNGNLRMESFTRYKFKDGVLVETLEYNANMELQQISKFSKKADEITNGYFNESHAVLDALGVLKKGTTIVTDKNGFEVEISTINGNREVEEYQRYTRDSLGNIIEEKVLNKLVENEYQYRYTFDATGNWIQKLIFKDGGLYGITQRSIAYY